MLLLITSPLEQFEISYYYESDFLIITTGLLFLWLISYIYILLLNISFYKKENMFVYSIIFNIIRVVSLVLLILIIISIFNYKLYKLDITTDMSQVFYLIYFLLATYFILSFYIFNKRIINVQKFYIHMRTLLLYIKKSIQNLIIKEHRKQVVEKKIFYAILHLFKDYSLVKDNSASLRGILEKILKKKQVLYNMPILLPTLRVGNFEGNRMPYLQLDCFDITRDSLLYYHKFEATRLLDWRLKLQKEVFIENLRNATAKPYISELIEHDFIYDLQKLDFASKYMFLDQTSPLGLARKIHSGADLYKVIEFNSIKNKYLADISHKFNYTNIPRLHRYSLDINCGIITKDPRFELEIVQNQKVLNSMSYDALTLQNIRYNIYTYSKDLMDQYSAINFTRKDIELVLLQGSYQTKVEKLLLKTTLEAKKLIGEAQIKKLFDILETSNEEETEDMGTLVSYTISTDHNLQKNLKQIIDHYIMGVDVLTLNFKKSVKSILLEDLGSTMRRMSTRLYNSTEAQEKSMQHLMDVARNFKRIDPLDLQSVHCEVVRLNILEAQEIFNIKDFFTVSNGLQFFESLPPLANYYDREEYLSAQRRHEDALGNSVSLGINDKVINKYLNVDLTLYKLFSNDKLPEFLNKSYLTKLVDGLEKITPLKLSQRDIDKLDIKYTELTIDKMLPRMLVKNFIVEGPQGTPLQNILSKDTCPRILGVNKDHNSLNKSNPIDLGADTSIITESVLTDASYISIISDYIASPVVKIYTSILSGFSLLCHNCLELFSSTNSDSISESGMEYDSDSISDSGIEYDSDSDSGYDTEYDSDLDSKFGIPSSSSDFMETVDSILKKAYEAWLQQFYEIVKSDDISLSEPLNNPMDENIIKDEIYMGLKNLKKLYTDEFFSLDLSDIAKRLGYEVQASKDQDVSLIEHEGFQRVLKKGANATEADMSDLSIQILKSENIEVVANCIVEQEHYTFLFQYIYSFPCLNFWVIFFLISIFCLKKYPNIFLPIYFVFLLGIFFISMVIIPYKIGILIWPYIKDYNILVLQTSLPQEGPPEEGVPFLELIIKNNENNIISNDLINDENPEDKKKSYNYVLIVGSLCIFFFKLIYPFI